LANEVSLWVEFTDGGEDREVITCLLVEWAANSSFFTAVWRRGGCFVVVVVARVVRSILSEVTSLYMFVHYSHCQEEVVRQRLESLTRNGENRCKGI